MGFESSATGSRDTAMEIQEGCCEVSIELGHAAYSHDCYGGVRLKTPSWR